MVRHFTTLVLVVLSAASASGTSQRASFHKHEAVRMSMGCAYSIEAYGSDAAALPRSVEEALDEVDRIDRLMSHYKADSALSRINREAARQPVTVEPELFDFISEAMRYHRESDGAFDITVGPLMKAWGFFRGDGRLPSDPELEAARRVVGASHVRLDPTARSISFDMEGVELDLGGIAKGYAVDRAVGILRHRGVQAALVSAGGSTIYGLGTPPDHIPFQVVGEDPTGPTSMAFTLRNRALSVAGTSQKSFESGGVTYSHIMDPRTGRPVQGMRMVVVLADTGTAADALDDALFVMGQAAGSVYLARLGNTKAVFVPAVNESSSRRLR